MRVCEYLEVFNHAVEVQAVVGGIEVTVVLVRNVRMAKDVLVVAYQKKSSRCKYIGTHSPPSMRLSLS